MTRDERWDWYLDLTPVECEVSDIIDAIYDDFESRICGNCKYFTRELHYINNNDHTGYYQIRCSRLDINYGEDFGCTIFERKEE